MGKNQEEGSGIKVPDPQHWKFSLLYKVSFSRDRHVLVGYAILISEYQKSM
jgi:hypothetical protein